MGLRRNTLNIGSRISLLRKEKGWLQADLSEKTGISQVMVGKYERGGAVPSLEVAKKVVDALEVSLDYLVGEGINVHLDKRNLKRLEELQLLDKNNLSILYDLMDTYIRDAKTRLAYK